MPFSVNPAQFCEAVPAANADLCVKVTKFFGIAELLCTFMSELLNPDGTLNATFLAQVATTVTPTGVIVYAAGTSLGDGWLLCDGSPVSRTTYASLYAVIGTRYGNGDAATTFNLPDLRGRSLLGAGTGSQGGALTTRDINTKYIGEENHTMTLAELVSHFHGFTGPTTRTEDRGDGANVVWRGSQTENTQNTGSGTPFNVIHPCMIAYGFIKT